MSKALFYQGQPTTTATAVVAGSSAIRAVDQASVTNTTMLAHFLSVWLVQSGDTAADDTVIYDAMPIASGGTPVILSALINMAIPANAEIHMAAETDNALTVTVSGKS